MVDWFDITKTRLGSKLILLLPDPSVEGDDDVFISPDTIPVTVPPTTVPSSVSGTDNSSTDVTPRKLEIHVLVTWIVISFCFVLFL